MQVSFQVKATIPSLSFIRLRYPSSRIVSPATELAFRKRSEIPICLVALLTIGIILSSRWLAFADSSSPQSMPSSSIQQPDSNRCVAPTDPKGNPIHLYIPDGQLRSSPVRFFVNQNISMTNNPVLKLYSGHALTTKKPTEGLPQPIDYVAPGQSWTENIDGQDFTSSGTVILVNLSRFPIDWYKPMKRVLAVLQWESKGEQFCAIAQGPVNLGNAPIAWLWTIAIGLTALLCIVALAHFGHGTSIAFLCADDGHLSLALTQIALWTIAVGAVTFFYGLIRFAVPVIPNTVLILMGMSLATGGLGAAAPPQIAPTDDTARTVPAPSAPGITAKKASPNLSDLIFLFPKDGPAQPSLSRAQMLFWTVLIILLFVSKSAIDGVLWDVPPGLVALMGFSQVGYVGPKFLGPYAGSK